MEKVAFAVASRAADNPRSGIREIFTLANDKAARGETVYKLMIGVPDARTPDTVIDGTIAALKAQKTQYTANAGITELREAIAGQVNRAHGLSVQADQVIVVPGAMAGLLFANFTIEPGNRILVPTPGYPNYKMQAGLTGLELLHYRLGIENGFQPDLDELEDLLKSDGAPVGAILINTPGNPTGTVFNKETISGIARLAEKHGVRIISDEVYKDIILDDGLEHISPARFAPDHTLLVGALSKKYSMTGMRVGFLIVPRHAIKDTDVLGEATISCAPSICQWGGVAA
ncbi:MAG: aminotransferase class I/II-fold pyridoxal phosphate-dependent enzyme, partial [Woeseia sp.]|nr:aminotransferase class I/II-fold pyridoxal phosphate-dependent enzyme [Woeseia sp.]